MHRSYTLDTEDVPKSGRARAVPLVDQVAGALGELSRRPQQPGISERPRLARADSLLGARRAAALSAY